MIPTDWLVVAPLLLFLIALNAFLMWANHETRAENRLLRRRLRARGDRGPVADDGRIPLGELMGGGEL